MSVENNFSKKRQKIKAKFSDQSDYFESKISSGKPVRLAYNFGAGVVVKHNNLDIEVGYNCKLQKKYQGHQGHVKLKVAF